MLTYFCEYTPYRNGRYLVTRRLKSKPFKAESQLQAVTAAYSKAMYHLWGDVKLFVEGNDKPIAQIVP